MHVTDLEVKLAAKFLQFMFPPTQKIGLEYDHSPVFPRHLDQKRRGAPVLEGYLFFPIFFFRSLYA